MSYFDSLKIDSWFKAVAYLGGVIVLLSLLFPVQIISNEVMAAIGFGMFLYGIGRWKNRKTVTEFIPAGKLSQERRIPDLIGILLEVSGFILVLGAAGYVIWTTL